MAWTRVEAVDMVNKKWLNSEYILKVEPIGSAVRLDKDCERVKGGISAVMFLIGQRDWDPGFKWRIWL